MFVLSRDCGWDQAQHGTFLYHLSVSLQSQLFHFPARVPAHTSGSAAARTAFPGSGCMCSTRGDIMRSPACQSSGSTVQTTRTSPRAPRGKGLTSNPNAVPLQNLISCFDSCAVFSPAHAHSTSHLLENSFQRIPKLLVFYPACKHFLSAQGHNSDFFLLFTVGFLTLHQPENWRTCISPSPKDICFSLL